MLATRIPKDSFAVTRPALLEMVINTKAHVFGQRGVLVGIVLASVCRLAAVALLPVAEQQDPGKELAGQSGLLIQVRGWNWTEKLTRVGIL